MSTATSALVQRAPKSNFECALCLLHKDESCLTIDSTPACLECVQSIMPKFEAAIQYEVNYPVEWTANLTLNPHDFTDFFDDFPAFMEKWTEREREYKTSGKDRVYCQGCAGYVGDRTMFLSKIALCKNCQIWVCSQCGSKDKDSPHECRTDASEDEMKVLEGTKKCPGCYTSIVLEDGCNDVVCTVCRTRQCYCCGEMHPKPDHWSRSRGGACPRFNTVDSGNALFNEDVAEVNEQQEGTVGVAVEVLLDMLNWARTATQQIVTLTTFPSGSVNPPQPIATHHRMIRENHRDIMQLLVNRGEDLQRDLRQQGLLEGNPDLGERLQETASKLAINVELYTKSLWSRRAYAEFARRHADIVTFIDHMPAGLFRFWPAMYPTFVVYQQVAPARLASAAPPRSEESRE